MEISVSVQKSLLTAMLPLLLFRSGAAEAQVLTSHYDNARTGQSPGIMAGIWPGGLDTNHFGKLFSQPVDGAVYGQPLYVPNLTIPGKGSHDVVFVVTEADSVYAFDADTNAGANASPLWRASLIDALHGAFPGETTVSNAYDLGCYAINPQRGITSTLPEVKATRAKSRFASIIALRANDPAIGYNRNPKF
jgi:hypothetical protein